MLYIIDDVTTASYIGYVLFKYMLTRMGCLKTKPADKQFLQVQIVLVQKLY